MKKILIVLFLLLPAMTFAGGFQVYLQGNKQIGMGLTGVGTALDAAVISLNPGALAMLKYNSIYGGGSLIFSATQYLAPQPGTYTAEMENAISTPFNFYAHYGLGESKRLQLGLGIFTPFGSGAKWADDWSGRFVIQSIDLKTIYFQPTISYAITEKFGVGAGFIVAKGDVMLQRGIPITDKDGNEGIGILKGDAIGYGFNAGVYFRPSDKFSVGVDYRSSVKLGVENGTADFIIASSLKDSFPSTAFSSTITLPFMGSVGLGFYPNQKLTLALDFNYTGWEVYDTLSFDYAANNSLLEDTKAPKSYKNSFAVRAGAAYKVSEIFTIRVGEYFDKTPVQDGFLAPETPDSDRIGLTAGLGIITMEDLEIDLSFLFIEGSERTGSYDYAGFEGTYKTQVFIPGLSLQYKF